MLNASAAAVIAVVSFRMCPSLSIFFAFDECARFACGRVVRVGARALTLGIDLPTGCPFIRRSPPLSVVGVMANHAGPGGAWNPGTVPVSDVLTTLSPRLTLRDRRFVP